MSIDQAAAEPVRASRERRIARQTLPAQVAEHLRDMIAEELLKPGGKLNEKALAETLHVSRTPLREGIKLLASEGLVELVPNRGAFVADPGAGELEDMLTALGGLESVAGELACLSASDDAIAEIRALHDRMLKAYARADRHAYFKLNQQIHLGIAAASGNATLRRLHATLNARLYRARFLSASSERMSRERWAGAVADHEAIIAALERRDGARMADLLKRHLGETWKAKLPALRTPTRRARGSGR